MRSRNPWLVAPWFVLSQTILYPHFFVSTVLTEATMDDMGSGSFVSPVTLVSQGLAGLVLGIPLLLVLVRYLWRRPRSWVGLRFEPAPFSLAPSSAWAWPPAWHRRSSHFCKRENRQPFQGGCR